MPESHQLSCMFRPTSVFLDCFLGFALAAMAANAWPGKRSLPHSFPFQLVSGLSSGNFGLCHLCLSGHESGQGASLMHSQQGKMPALPFG